jgi:hypothetical protein
VITAQSAETVLAAAAAARAFAPDTRKAVRRVLALGVKAGARELARSGRVRREGRR